jgi:hypothetical protein
MPKLRLTLRCLDRTEILPDDEEGNRLSEMVRRAVEKGRASVVAVALREDRLDLISLGPIIAAKVPVQRFLAGLTRSTAEGAGMVDAVGVIGVVKAKRGVFGRGVGPNAPAIPMAMAFLEWPDGRWWHWRALIDPEDPRILDASEILNRAVDGDPLPRDFGRWWSLGRRSKVTVHLSKIEMPEPVDEPEVTDESDSGPIVH